MNCHVLPLHYTIKRKIEGLLCVYALLYVAETWVPTERLKCLLVVITVCWDTCQEQDSRTRLLTKRSEENVQLCKIAKFYRLQARRNMGGCSLPTFLQSNENENRQLFVSLKKALNPPPTKNFVPPGLDFSLKHTVILHVYTFTIL